MDGCAGAGAGAVAAGTREADDGAGLGSGAELPVTEGEWDEGAEDGCITKGC